MMASVILFSQEVAGGARDARDVGELRCDGWSGKMRCGGRHLWWGNARDVGDHPRVGHEQVDCCHERLEVYRERGPVAGGQCWRDGRLGSVEHERGDGAVQGEV